MVRVHISTFVVLSLCLLLPGGDLQAQDADRKAEAVALKQAVDGLAEAGARLAELARVQIAGGQTEEARSTLDLLDEVLELKEKASKKLQALGIAAEVLKPAVPAARPPVASQPELTLGVPSSAPLARPQFGGPSVP